MDLAPAVLLFSPLDNLPVESPVMQLLVLELAEPTPLQRRWTT